MDLYPSYRWNGGLINVLNLKGRSVQKTVQIEVGYTLLDMAMKHSVDWGFSCSRGTCARCRCQIEQGSELLSEPNDAEKDRLEPDEIEQGFRLGCQAKIKFEGQIKATNKPYF